MDPLGPCDRVREQQQQQSPSDSRLSKDSIEKKRAAIPTSPVLTQSRKIFPRLNTNSSYETAGETSNSFHSQICKISSEEAGRISVEMQDNSSSSASRLRAMSLKNTTTATAAGSQAAGAVTDYTKLTMEAATGGYTINMAQQATTPAGLRWAEPHPPPLYDVSTIDLSAILDNNRDNELNTPTMELEEEVVLGEFRVEQPIVLHEGVLSELWNLTPPASKVTRAPSFPSAGKMVCVNPLDVEGRRSGGKKRMAVQQQTGFEVTVKAATTTAAAAKVKKGQRPKLRLTMPPPPTVKTETEDTAAPSIGLTPIIEKTLLADEGSFDLLAYVTDATIKVDDPVAIQHMGLSPTATSPPTIETIKSEPVASTSAASSPVGPALGKRRRVMTERARAATAVKEEKDDEEWQPKPKRRGRPPGKESMPPRAVAAAAASSDHSYGGRAGSGKTAKAAVASEDEVKEAKYRRMRDLNNVASKRCRQNRKKKQSNQEEVAEALERKNMELKLRVGQMEELLERLKSKFVEKVANPPSLKI